MALYRQLSLNILLWLSKQVAIHTITMMSCGWHGIWNDCQIDCLFNSLSRMTEKLQISVFLALCEGWLVNSCHKGSAVWEKFPWHNPDSKVHGANMGPIWGPTGPRWAPCWPVNLAIWVVLLCLKCHHAPQCKPWGIWCNEEARAPFHLAIVVSDTMSYLPDHSVLP